jgi:hypothetical protein
MLKSILGYTPSLFCYYNTSETKKQGLAKAMQKESKKTLAF